MNEEIGYWLARILYSHNPARSDSAKIAGVMELFRVQVRFALFWFFFFLFCFSMLLVAMLVTFVEFCILFDGKPVCIS